MKLKRVVLGLACVLAWVIPALAAPFPIGSVVRISRTFAAGSTPVNVRSLPVRWESTNPAVAVPCREDGMPLSDPVENVGYMHFLVTGVGETNARALSPNSSRKGGPILEGGPALPAIGIVGGAIEGVVLP